MIRIKAQAQVINQIDRKCYGMIKLIIDLIILFHVCRNNKLIMIKFNCVHPWECAKFYFYSDG
ncbi:hypothetical protein DX130_06415 [Paenibacillus paeoniae]|uniref:Uncharacterized protein n=1 Tax=Paenibacillus paeoniae TaxID=2292705 RepID=A0A371PKD3_9BACL|nr:hypothetical protein DX130_06415 [Paenibacillus paeoniae]